MKLEPKRTLLFLYDDREVEWTIEQLGRQQWQFYCKHPLFIKRYGDATQTAASLFDLLGNMTREEEDFDFFVGLLLSFMTREPLG